jgi:hypothetical protein
MKFYPKFLPFAILVATAISCTQQDPFQKFLASCNCVHPTPPGPQVSSLYGSWNEINSGMSGCTDPANSYFLTGCLSNCASVVITASSVTKTQGATSTRFDCSEGTNGTMVVSQPGAKPSSISLHGNTLTWTAVLDNGCTLLENYVK